MKKYIVISNFTDLQDNDHVYTIGDVYPHKNKKIEEISAERIEELKGKENKKRRALIKEIEIEETAEPKAEETAEPKAEETAEPKAEETAEPKAEETAEPKAEKTAEPKAEETAEPKAEKTVEAKNRNTRNRN